MTLLRPNIKKPRGRPSLFAIIVHIIRSWFTHKKKELSLMAAISELQTAANNLTTAVNNVGNASATLITSIGSPVPQSVIDSLNANTSQLNTIAQNLATATPPPATPPAPAV